MLHTYSISIFVWTLLVYIVFLISAACKMQRLLDGRRLEGGTYFDEYAQSEGANLRLGT